MKRRGWRLGIWTTVVMVALGVGGMARADGMGDVAGANADGANGTIRLATYNIQNGREMNRAELTLEKTAEAIDRLNADVVGLQEVDRNTYRVDDLDLATELSKRVGRVPTYGKAIDLGEGNMESPFFPGISRSPSKISLFRARRRKGPF